MSIFARIVYQWNEFTMNRTCNTLAEFAAYVPKLATPENIARWLDNNLWYVPGTGGTLTVTDYDTSVVEY